MTGAACRLGGHQAWEELPPLCVVMWARLLLTCRMQVGCRCSSHGELLARLQRPAGLRYGGKVCLVGFESA